jgi:nitroreductase
VDNPEFVRDIAAACVSDLARINTFVAQAPVIIVILRKKANLSSRLGGLIKHRDYRGLDLGAAAENLCLQAVHEGLGTCMIGWYNDKAIRRILSLPRGTEIELLVTLGHPLPEHNLRISKRKPLAQIVCRNGLTEQWPPLPNGHDQD